MHHLWWETRGKKMCHFLSWFSFNSRFLYLTATFSFVSLSPLSPTQSPLPSCFHVPSPPPPLTLSLSLSLSRNPPPLLLITSHRSPLIYSHLPPTHLSPRGCGGGPGRRPPPVALGPLPCIGWPASGSHPGPWANTMTASTEDVCVGIWITPEEIIQGSGRNKGYVRNGFLFEPQSHPQRCCEIMVELARFENIGGLTMCQL